MNLVHSCDRRGVPCFASCEGDEAKYQEEWREWRQRVAGCGICGSEKHEWGKTKGRWNLRTCLDCGAQEVARGWVARNSASSETAKQPINPAV
jgi:hypothetical protein